MGGGLVQGLDQRLLQDGECGEQAGHVPQTSTIHNISYRTLRGNFRSGLEVAQTGLQAQDRVFDR